MRRITRITSTFQNKHNAVASALVAGAVATTALTVATQVPSPSAAAAIAEQGAKAPNGARAELLADANAEVKAAKKGEKKAKREGKTLTATKMVKAENIIALAKSQVGHSEDGAGKSKFGRWYAGTERAKETMQRDAGGGSPKIYEDAAWCSMFISWLGDRTGFTDQMGADAWTIEHAEWFKDKGRWGTEPKPGAVVFFDWDGGKSMDAIDHVGLVTKNLGDGEFATVEGNSNDAVESKTRGTDKVVGFGYPDYAK
ncbi:CHAP domain-containing protein [Thermomonospora umbrina]|nr:CHAP domain-containing protein [Thermomonospora umbrina]